MAPPWCWWTVWWRWFISFHEPKQLLVKEHPSYSLTMFFSIMVFLKISFLIMGFNLYPNSGSDSLNFQMWKWNCHHLSNPKRMGKQNGSIKFWNNIYNAHWLEILAMVEFAYNNIMHSSTQQTFLFANHGLHPKFDIQGVHKIVNPMVKDQTMWLVDVWIQLVFNLKEAQKQYEENVDEHQKEQPNFKVRDQVWFRWQHINNKAIKEVRSLEVKSILHCETNQCRGFPTQASKFYENPFYVSCFLVGTLSCVYHFRNNPWSLPPIEVNGEQEYEMEDILYSRIYKNQL